MGEPTVECYNCGRENPGWAQICRTCGVSLRGAERFASGPPPRFPTDTRSIVSIVAAVGTIAAAIIVGVLLSNLDPSGPVAGAPQATAGVAATSTPPPATATVSPTTVATAAPTATPPPPLPGELVFGTALDPTTRVVSAPQTTFTLGDNFAYSVTMDEAIGAEQIFVEVVKVEDGEETVLQEPTGGQLIDPAQPTAAFEVPADTLILGPDGVADSEDEFGTGSFVMRIYLGPDQLIAQGTFELTA